jgi:hypothetical protein
MASLRNTTSGQEVTLLAEHLVGRSRHCDLQLDESYVSSQHASIRWAGDGWEINDLGSRNGTWLNGALLEPHSQRGKGHRLEKDALVAFGHEEQLWAFWDDSPPCVMAVPLLGGDPVFLVGDMLGIPSAEAPEAVVVRGANGSWILEAADGALTRIGHGTSFEVAGERWRFYCPNVITRTTGREEQPSVRAIGLRFDVSPDEEHVSLRASSAGKLLDLGSRSCNYSLLTLARHRLEDVAAGIRDTSCGWVYQKDLLRKLAISSTQLNVDIFRIRSQFSALGFHDAAGIVERRPRTTQLRIGVTDLVVNRT